MTELMKQLQQWANEGRYDWENGTFNWKRTERFHPYLSMGEDQKEKYQTLDWKALVQLVLDGTIQVWRPVEHYKPKIGADVIAIVRGMVLEGSIDDMGLFDDDARYCGVSFTHWQPLPQPPQKGGK